MELPRGDWNRNWDFLGVIVTISKKGIDPIYFVRAKTSFHFQIKKGGDNSEQRQETETTREESRKTTTIMTTTNDEIDKRRLLFCKTLHQTRSSRRQTANDTTNTSN
jgi:hypothetical protein